MFRNSAKVTSSEYLTLKFKISMSEWNQVCCWEQNSVHQTNEIAIFWDFSWLNGGYYSNTSAFHVLNFRLQTRTANCPFRKRMSPTCSQRNTFQHPTDLHHLHHSQRLVCGKWMEWSRHDLDKVWFGPTSSVSCIKPEHANVSFEQFNEKQLVLKQSNYQLMRPQFGRILIMQLYFHPSN